MNDIVIGIDLGTTFSAMAYVDEHGDPRVIPNADGKTTTPSVVMIDGSQIVVGEQALNQAITRQEHVVRWVKRRMGDNDYRFQGRSAVEISAEVLKVLKADGELHLGVPIEQAVITCPAYFSGLEVENTKRAGVMAGLRVKEIVKEPTAAAVHYGVEQMHEGETILVCDLGGGTYDATVLSFENGVFIPRASMGDRQLGGHDWTMDLMELVSEQVLAATGTDPRDDLVGSEMLYEACERAKRDFARVPEVSMSCRVAGRIEQRRITRDEFEAKTADRILTLVSWSEQAVAKAGHQWPAIDRILLVGGSSRLRRMAAALEQASARPVIQVKEPDLAVAFGASIIARGQVRRRRAAGGLVDAPRGGLEEVVTARILERHLGTRVFVFVGDRARIANTMLVPQGTQLPANVTQHFSVSSDGQKVFDVPIVEFEHEDDTQIEVFHNFRFSLGDAKRGDRIRVTFDQDLSGIPDVTAVHERLNRQLPVEKLAYAEPRLDEVMKMRAKPRWVVFAIDTSASMRGIKMDSAKRAVIDNARTLLGSGAGCKVAVVRFDSTVDTVCRPTDEIHQVEGAVSRVQTGGTTHMDEGIRLAVELAMAAPAEASRDVVMVTDGQPDDDRRRYTIDAAAWARDRGVTLSTVGIGSEDVDLDFLNQLTPLSLVIDHIGQGQLSDTMMTLLTKAASGRALVEPN